jgi:signal transduction histidine kinase
MRFQERASERERIASQIHDTFIQDLIGTALQLELVGLQLEEDPNLAQRALSELETRLRGVIARTRDMLSNLHSMAGPEQGLSELLLHVDSEFRLSDMPRYELVSAGMAFALPASLRDEVYWICREALANAFRHASATKVVVTLTFGQERLGIVIADDGVGMSKEMQANGRAGHFGLSGMRAHARRLGVQLAVASEPGQGTEVSLELDLRKTPLERLRQAARSMREGVRAYTGSGKRFEAQDRAASKTLGDE